MQECDAPCAVAWEFTSRSSMGITPGARLQCAAGHFMSWFGDEIPDPFVDEPLPPDFWDRD
jgi:hypothetical protein